jgi:hypothetical protein
MKNYNNFINEELDSNEFKIIELSYYDFINLCDTYKEIDYKDESQNTICGIINYVKQNPDIFSNTSNKYHFLAAIQDKKILGVFYKQLRGNPDMYDDGYIISKNNSRDLLDAMKKIGPYTTFSNLSNVGSLRTQVRMGAQFLCMTDSIPSKPLGTYKKEFTDQSLIQLMKDEKIYFIGSDEKFFFYDENTGKFKIKELIEFLKVNKNIKLVEPKEGLASKIKLYFLFPKLGRKKYL